MRRCGPTTEHRPTRYEPNARTTRKRPTRGVPCRVDRRELEVDDRRVPYATETVDVEVHVREEEDGVARSVRVYGCDLGKTQIRREDEKAQER